MPATLRDLSKKVGKSITTVSRALNNHEDISLETRALVHQAAKELGYRPSITAQRLQKKRSDTIGFILPPVGPDFSDPFYSQVLAGIASQAALLGVDVLVSATEEKQDDLEIYVSHIQTRRVDGFILVRIGEDDARIEFLGENHIPVVTFGKSRVHTGNPYVDLDAEFGMMLAAEYLIRLGHRKFALVLPPPYLVRSGDMLRGVRRKLAENGLDLPEDWLAYGDYSQRSGYKAAQALLSGEEHPTAILAGGDLMAFGVVSAAHEIGLQVGKDLSVTGFEDIPSAEHSQPPLTSLHQPTYLIGQRLCEILVKTVRGETGQSEVFYPSLIIRQSCGPVG